jgi:C1A family cysteine protease
MEEERTYKRKNSKNSLKLFIITAVAISLSLILVGGGSGTPQDILSYYRNLGSNPSVVETTVLLKAADDWNNSVAPSGFDFPITTQQLLTLADEWANPSSFMAKRLMHPDEVTLAKWKNYYDAAPVWSPPIILSPSPTLNAGISGGSNSLLSHINYNVIDRDQGGCGNCWVWAGTGAVEVANDVNNGAFNRLSIQYLNSLYNGGTGGGYACNGGWLHDLVNFYSSTTTFAVPWSNTNANWQDASSTFSTSVQANTIATTPHYNINKINDLKIETHKGQANAIANIKSAIDNNIPVWFGFFLPDNNDWNNFFDFWNNQPESAIWSPDFSCGHTWINGQGGGHAVLIVGYDDTNPSNAYWIALNSWGPTAKRPNGLFRINMNINYDCSLTSFSLSNSLYAQVLNIDMPSRITDFVGTWLNVDPNTNGIPKIEIGSSGNNLVIHGYGACSPTYCDWGTVTAPFSGNPVTAVYTFSFKVDTLTMTLLPGERLHVNSKNVFTDGSHRDYIADYYFTKQSQSLVAPTQISPANGSVFNYYPRTTTLKWSTVNDATSYNVEVDCYSCCQINKWCSDVGGATRIESNLQTTSYTFDFVGAQPGRWRVWAVDSNGQVGPKSSWRYFSYTI